MEFLPGIGGWDFAPPVGMYTPVWDLFLGFFEVNVSFGAENL
jgi:hypothetical protein